MALIGMVGMLSGVLGAASSAAEQQAGRTDVDTTWFAYNCEFPSGRHQIGVRIQASFPESGAVGQPIQPTDVTVRASIPEAALADLTGWGAATVTGTANLTAAVAQNGTSNDVSWSELNAPSTAIPESGELALAASGKVPPATVRDAGPVTFTAGKLALQLGMRQADGKVTDPALLSLDCLPEAGEDTLLATVPVAGEETTPPTSGRSEDPRDGTNPPFGGAETRAAEDDIPEECHRIGNEGTPMCTYIGGYTNVRKLEAAARIPLGILNIDNANPEPCNDGSGMWCQTAIGELNHDGKQQFPPEDNSFLPFGFMPTTATMELRQSAPMEIDIRFQAQPPFDGSVVGNAKMVARVYDATVNGARLDVGNHCETTIDITLTADYPEGYNVQDGGILDGTTTIPPFSGCGAKEDLDPLLTGLISGAGNYVKMTQGNACWLGNGFRCPPEKPELRR
ncbi:MAG: hypothetical protein GEU98_16210 [Pseudonocardiaceae bacterium]|nr:hypothetical protein [Pseudonocardiaceae bacterium]